MLLVYFIGKEKLVSRAELGHLIDLVMVHYVEKTYVENEFKLSRVANLEFKIKEDEGLIGQVKGMKHAEKNVIKDYEHLKKVVEEQVSSAVDSDKIDIEFSEKIFLHNDEDRRVTFEHIRSFYQKAKKEKLNKLDFIYYFGHALKGKSEQIYRTPISRNIDDVKKEVFKKIDINALGPNQGKKIKQVKKLIEDNIVDNFQKSHFGIAPLTVGKFKDLCLTYKINAKDLHFNESTGMIRNACMSPNCAFFMQPLKPAEFSEHMRLWKQKKQPEEVLSYLLKAKEVDPKKHKKSNEEVLEYIYIIKKSFSE